MACINNFPFIGLAAATLAVTTLFTAACEHASPTRPDTVDDMTPTSASPSGATAASATAAAVTSVGARPMAGWSSVTGHHIAETALQRAIVAAANAAAGNPSPPSRVAYGGGTWQTDTADNDGNRMRKAITTYRNWTRAPGKVTLVQIRQQMLQLFADSKYSSRHRAELVDHIISRENRWTTFIGPLAPIDSDQATLTELGIGAQCMEFVQRTAIGAGGHGKPYGSPGVAADAYRPGMALYLADRSHAMIIVDLNFDARGTPMQARVAEANWPAIRGNWSNPAGQKPWLRTVQNTRVLNLDRTMTVIDLR